MATPESGWDDPKLAGECLRDGPGAWEELIRRYGPTATASVRGAFMRYGTARIAEIEEVVQKVFCELWEKRKLAALRDARQLGAYVASLAAARAVDAARVRCRSRGRLQSLGEPGESVAADGHPNPRQAVLASEAREAIRRELEGLPYKESYILRLNVDEELTHQEIGRLLDIPQDTVSTVIRRAREKIRMSLELKGFEDEA